MRNLLLCLSVSALAGCAGSTPYVEQVEPADQPVFIPERWLSDQEIEVLWGKDRAALTACGLKVEVLSGRELPPS